MTGATTASSFTARLALILLVVAGAVLGAASVDAAALSAPVAGRQSYAYDLVVHSAPTMLSSASPTVTGDASRRVGAMSSDGGLASPVASVVAAETEAAAINGETAATRFGRLMHQTYDYGPGFEREFTLESGGRVDAINFETERSSS